ncbi:MAG: septum formation initiator family protein [Dermatophilaceae bacterium]
MATRGPGAAKGRVTARPGARASSARRTTIRSDKARPASRGGAAARKPRGPSSPAGRDQGSGLWRWGVITLVALVLVVLLAPTVRSYFAQRGEIAALERQVAQGEERVAALEAEEERWRDPAYIEQQARERLKFVRPGEVSYTVIGADELQSQQIATGAVAESRPWYDRLWGSIGQADRTDAEPVP